MVQIFLAMETCGVNVLLVKGLIFFKVLLNFRLFRKAMGLFIKGNDDVNSTKCHINTNDTLLSTAVVDENNEVKYSFRQTGYRICRAAASDDSQQQTTNSLITFLQQKNDSEHLIRTPDAVLTAEESKEAQKYTKHSYYKL